MQPYEILSFPMGTGIVRQVITDWQLGGHLGDTLASYRSSGNVRWVPAVTPLRSAPTRTAGLPSNRSVEQRELAVRTGERSGVDAGEELGEHAGVESCREVPFVVAAEIERRAEEVVGGHEEMG